MVILRVFFASILIAMVFPAAIVAAKVASGCEGLPEYSIAMIESRTDFVEALEQQGVVSNRDPDSYTPGVWISFAEIAGNWQEVLEAMTVPEWVEDWHQTQLELAVLYEDIAIDATGADGPHLEEYGDPIRSIIVESEAAANEILTSCPEFQSLLLGMELLTGGVDTMSESIQELTVSSVVPGIVSYDYPGYEHSSDEVTYTESPPVGGFHNPAWQNCGFYDAPVRDEHVVHSLEHGAVWITYRPELSVEDVDVLRALADSDNYLLISPYEDQTAPVVATAWNHQLDLTSVTDPALATFIEQFVQGSQTPEPGAVCSGGISTTVESR